MESIMHYHHCITFMYFIHLLISDPFALISASITLMKCFFIIVHNICIVCNNHLLNINKFAHGLAPSLLLTTCSQARWFRTQGPWMHMYTMQSWGSTDHYVQKGGYSDTISLVSNMCLPGQQFMGNLSDFTMRSNPIQGHWAEMVPW